MLRRFLLAFLLFLPCCAVNATAVWDVDIHNFYSTDSWQLQGTFTTAGTDFADGQLVTSFSGTFSDEFVIEQHVTLIQLGLTISAGPGQIFVYDNLFFGPSDRPGLPIEDSFNVNGLLLQAGDSPVNIFAENGLIGLAVHGDFAQLNLLTGSIVLDHVTAAVGEPGVVYLLLLGLVAVGTKPIVRALRRLA